MCDGQAEEANISLEGVLEHRNSVRRQRPHAYAFCLTSVHHLCTALLNTVRLRKLQTFQVTNNAVAILTCLRTSHKP